MTENEKEYHINNFRNALLSVAPEYFGIPALQGQIHINERAFSYELYHQLRLVYNGSNWYVNGELRKGLFFMPAYGQENTLVPDLVIHEHQTTTEDIIAIEIKTNPNVTGPEIIKDLEKLEIYTRPGAGYLNYHIGIMLVVNSNFRDKFEHMRTNNTERIKELLNFHRLAIWNIETPTPIPVEGDITVQLNPDCLEIIRSENIQ